ncbi:MAG: hypothetical protein AVDCRST_MAG71-2039 [uncultured Lysobacter sp.]|uniref:STAS/SEC14 domain-containing protein n=1 Tax=uncultured Lysobacter sp. TaxID=271060 RepID=A0A6J4LMZ0_9GAMM|nr:MAG: hypothetical protein AVDCRST_MAG71-2039 [uncultured Lysobacter sp.]
MPIETLRGEGFRVELEQRDGYLRALVCDGTDSAEVSIAYHRLLGAECLRRGARRLLVLEDLSDTDEAIDVDSIAAAALESGYDRFRTAFVELRGKHDVNEQGELASFMHGLTIRVFITEAQARQWLLYGEIEEDDETPGDARVA